MSDKKSEAPFAYHGLDRIFHEKARLGIVSFLANHPMGVVFAELKEMCGLTDGNLSRHLQVLEEAGYVEIQKGYEGKRPCTRCQLTEAGQQRFLDYLDVLEQVLQQAAGARKGNDDAVGVLLT